MKKKQFEGNAANVATITDFGQELGKGSIMSESVAVTVVGKVGLGVFGLGVVLFTVAFSVPYWVTASRDNAHAWFGLWQYCASIDSYTECHTTLKDDFLENMNFFKKFPDWFKGTQASACFALLTIIANIALRIVFLLMRLKKIFLISIALDLVAAGLAFLAAVVFGSEMSKISNFSLNWGFAFDIISGILFVAAAVCFLIEYCRRR